MMPAEKQIFEGRLKKEAVLRAALNAEKRARGLTMEPISTPPKKEPIMENSATKGKPMAWGAALAFALLVAVVLMYQYWVV